MGFRMRKSIRLAPGVRLNVSKGGLGVSAGVGGVRYSVHSSGRRTVSARTGIPGVYYQESVGGGRRARPRAAAPVAAPPPRAAKPGSMVLKREGIFRGRFPARRVPWRRAWPSD
jgi:hypothetical protein